MQSASRAESPRRESPRREDPRAETPRTPDAHAQPAERAGPERLRRWFDLVERQLLLRRGGSGRQRQPRRSPSRDLRLLPVALTAWGSAAIAIRLDSSAALLVAALLAACTGVCAARALNASSDAPLVRILLVMVGAAAMVFLSAPGKLEQRSVPPLTAAIAAEADVTVELVALAEPTKAASPGPDGRARYILEAEVLEGTYAGDRFTARVPVVVLGGSDWSAVEHGDVLRSAGRLAATEPGRRAQALLIASAAPQIDPDGRPDSPIDDLRDRFLDLASRTGVPDGGLMAGMVIGARSSVEQEIVTVMRATGLTHLTAVSGANCSYVLAFIFVVVRGCRLPRWCAAVVGIAALVAFVLLVRPEPSVLRAAVMGAIGVLAVFTGRGRLSLTLLFLSIAALVTVDPWLSGEYAFILSVVATAGLVLAGPVLAARLGEYLPAWLAQLIAIPLAAQVFCSPILTLIQPDMPTYSLLANVLVAPLVPFITILGMVSVMLVPFLPLVALPFAIGAGWGALGVSHVARFFASAPLSALPWPDGPAGLALAALISSVLLAAAVWRPNLPPIAATVPASMRRGVSRLAGATVGWLALGCILGLGALWAWKGTTSAYPAVWTVAACDVGQGDGFAVRTGRSSAMVFDAGPEAAPMEACLDRLGVKSVDLLVLTHLHEDHYGGIAGVFAGRSVQRVVYSTGKDALPGLVARTIGGQGLTAQPVGAGDSGNTGNVQWRVLWPDAQPAPGSENDASAVVLVEVSGAGSHEALQLLFTGDLEEEAARSLLAAHPDLVTQGVDVLKVAHHGARNGGSGFIEALSPRVALISAGEDNEYGHPHPETLASLAAVGAHTARTDTQGTILLHAEADAIHVRLLR